MDYTDNKIAIVGYGVEGRAAADYLSKHGAQISILDGNESTSTDERHKLITGKDYLENLADYDLVVRSPSIRPELLKTAKKVTSSTQIFFDNCIGSIIGITGTKGKGTTSSLSAKLLESQGVKVLLGGNIGVPMLSFLDDVEPSDAVILELSSFQLCDLEARSEIAVCLMIEPDHMNWHKDMAEYIRDKANITKNQRQSDVLIYHPTNRNTAEVVENSQATKIPAINQNVQIQDDELILRGIKLMPVKQVGLIGDHNLENITSALNVLDQYCSKHDLEIDFELAAEVLRKFIGLPNRLEFIRELNGVRYINDSYSSTPSAAIAGIKAVDQPVIAIIGGVDKGVELDALAESLIDIKQAVLIGQTAIILKTRLESRGASNFVVVDGDMKQIINSCQSLAEPGDTVLMSPGSSSFDMFLNFTDRGNQFRDVVNNL